MSQVVVVGAILLGATVARADAPVARGEAPVARAENPLPRAQNALPRAEPTRSWEDRTFPALELGVGPVAGRTSESTFGAGGVLALGLHTVRPEQVEHSEKSGFTASPDLRWCAPLACFFPFLMMLAPIDSMLGNELGVDLRGELMMPVDGGTQMRLGAQPTFRYASGRFRTGTTLGTYAPEVSYVNRSRGHDALGLAWSFYPVDVLVDGRHLAVGLDPLRLGIDIPFDGTRVSGDLHSELTFRWVR